MAPTKRSAAPAAAAAAPADSHPTAAPATAATTDAPATGWRATLWNLWVWFLRVVGVVMICVGVGKYFGYVNLVLHNGELEDDEDAPKYFKATCVILVFGGVHCILTSLPPPKFKKMDDIYMTDEETKAAEEAKRVKAAAAETKKDR